MGYGVVRFDRELLDLWPDLLWSAAWPVGTVFVAAVYPTSRRYRCFVVESPDLPDIGEGRPPLYVPEFAWDRGGPYFIGWGAGMTRWRSRAQAAA